MFEESSRSFKYFEVVEESQVSSGLGFRNSSLNSVVPKNSRRISVRFSFCSRLFGLSQIGSGLSFQRLFWLF